ncbi:MAG: DUF1801 domain-containing protein [Bacilli bacterium]|nr:DUF1801 domain-containing protein [Bacilli bacterium]
MDRPNNSSKIIDEIINNLFGWEKEKFTMIRKAIILTDNDIIEEVKWDNVPTWYFNNKIICTGEIYKDKIKLTFAKGALIKENKDMFNSSLSGNIRRAIDFMEHDEVDETKLKCLIKETIDLLK